MQLYERIEKEIVKKIGTGFKIEFNSKFADLAIPCFSDPNPVEKAAEISRKLAKIKYVKTIQSQGPFVNLFLDWSLIGLDLIEEVDKKYGGNFSKGPAIIEHTSTNPNAPPHVGRARNTMIGDSIVRLLKFSGMKVSTHYYVNDMGKQIALLVWAGKDRKKASFNELIELYSEANKKMEADKRIEQEVFELLKRFEEGDKKISKQFRDVVSVAVEGQKRTYSTINADFDEFDYESDFLESDEMNEIMEKLRKTGKIFTDAEGRNVLNTNEVAKDTYFVLSRSNGTSLYGARDLAYTLYKHKLAKGNLNILVLGEDQKLYFQQIAYAMKLAGYTAPKVVHYSFVLLPDGKMSTRKGNVVLLEDWLKEVYDKAYQEISLRYPTLKENDKSDRSRKISIAAIRYGILKVSSDKNVIFDLNSAVRFDGDTGPYLQYTYARANSITEKSKKKKGKINFGEEEKDLVKLLSKFPGVIRKSYDELRPHHVAEYAHDLSDTFNSYYQNVKVIGSDKEYSRIQLIRAVMIVLENCLSILGIDALKEM